MRIGNKHFSFFNFFSEISARFYWIFSRIEKLLVNEKDKVGKPAVFIVGAPRTGSTYLYQIITNYFDCIYINNITHLFAKNPLFGMWLSKLFFKNKAHNTFKSDFGLTQAYSLNAPSECLRFWSLWSANKARLDIGNLKGFNISGLKKSLENPIRYFKKPFVFKNLSIGQFTELTETIHPNSKYIWIKRDVLQVAQSILDARVKQKGSEELWFSIKPQEFGEIQDYDIYHQIIAQIYFLEKRIYLETVQFDEAKLMVIDFDQLRDNYGIFEEIRNFIHPSLAFKPNTDLNSDFAKRYSRKKKDINPNFVKYIDLYDWDEYKT